MPASALPRTVGQSAALDRFRERKPAAEQQEHVPGNAPEVRAFQQGPALLRAIRDQEQEQARQQRDRRVVEFGEPRQLAQQRAGDPEHCGHDEDRGHAPLGDRHRPEREARLDERIARGRLRSELERKCDLHQHQPGDWHQEQDRRNPEREPLGETDGLVVVLLHEADDERIGRRADERTEATNGRGIGDAEDDRTAEVPRVAIVRRGVGRHDRRNREGDRQHHQRGRCVLDPHADEAGRAHHAEHESLRIARPRARRSRRRCGGAGCSVPSKGRGEIRRGSGRASCCRSRWRGSRRMRRRAAAGWRAARARSRRMEALRSPTRSP